MRRYRIVLMLLLAFLCFFGCQKEEETPLTSGDNAPPATENTPITPIISVEGEVGDTFAMQTVQMGETPMLQVSYQYLSFDFDAYKNPTVEFYHNGRLLGQRALDDHSSFLAQSVCYGCINVRITATAEQGVVLIRECAVPVTASAYHFAVLSDPMAVMKFSMAAFSRGNDSTQGASVFDENSALPVMQEAPAFMVLDHADAYTWGLLPQNTYTLPFPTEGVSFEDQITLTQSYIRELYEVAPDTVFHLYCDDVKADLILRMFEMQGITRYRVTLIADGNRSLLRYARIATPASSVGESSYAVYRQMAKEWIRVKTTCANGFGANYTDLYMHGGNDGVFANYPFVIATLEENVTWWSADISHFITLAENNVFIQDLLNGTNASGLNEKGDRLKLISPSLKELYKGLTSVDRISFDQLYCLETDLFRQASLLEKQVLVIMGGNVIQEQALEAYLSYLRTYFGNAYQIYYKDHADAPMAFNAEKQALFERLGIAVLEAEIPDTMILEHCPTVAYGGFINLIPDGASVLKVIFGTKQDAENFAGLHAQLYISPLSYHGDKYATYYGDLVIEYPDSNRVDMYTLATDTVTNIIP